MTRFICLTLAAAAFALTMVTGDIRAQDTPKTLPSFVTNPWANPATHYYRRQREIQEQRSQDLRIQQLQKLELLKALNKSKTEQKAEEETLPHTSAKYKKPSSTSSTKSGKDKMGKADKIREDAVLENPLKGSETRPGYSRTWSNYKGLIRQQ